MAGSSFSWDDGELKLRVSTFNPKVREAIGVRFRYHTPRAETWMKHNAPWNDRTTNARNGLFTNFSHAIRGALFTMVLAHSVDYGIYLELGTENMKARPVILPAVNLFSGKIQKSLVKLIDRLG